MVKKWWKWVLGTFLAAGAALPALSPEMAIQLTTAMGALVLPTTERPALPPAAEQPRRPLLGQDDSAKFYEGVATAVEDSVYRTSEQVRGKERLPSKKEKEAIEKAQKQKYLAEKAKRIGAVCRDGTESNSTGKGACSGHGGVARWILATSEEEAEAIKAKRKAEKQEQRAAPQGFYTAPQPAPDPYGLFWHVCIAALAALVVISVINKRP